MKLMIENMDNKQMEIYEKLLNECKNNNKGMSPKQYFMDLYTRGYFANHSKVADLVYSSL